MSDLRQSVDIHLRALDEVIQGFEDDLTRLRNAVMVDLNATVAGLQRAAELIDAIRIEVDQAAVTAGERVPVWSSREDLLIVISRVSAHLQDLKAEQSRHLLAKLSQILESGKVEPRIKRKFNAADQLRRAAALEVGALSSSKTPPILPGPPQSEQWLEWAWAQTEPQLSDLLSSLSHLLPRLTAFIEEIEPNWWLPPLQGYSAVADDQVVNENTHDAKITENATSQRTDFTIIENDAEPQAPAVNEAVAGRLDLKSVFSGGSLELAEESGTVAANSEENPSRTTIDSAPDVFSHPPAAPSVAGSALARDVQPQSEPDDRITSVPPEQVASFAINERNLEISSLQRQATAEDTESIPSKFYDQPSFNEEPSSLTSTSPTEQSLHGRTSIPATPMSVGDGDRLVALLGITPDSQNQAAISSDQPPLGEDQSRERAQAASASTAPLTPMPAHLLTEATYYEYYWLSPSGRCEQAPWAQNGFDDGLRRAVERSTVEHRFLHAWIFSSALTSRGLSAGLTPKDIEAVAAIWNSPFSSTTGNEADRSTLLKQGLAEFSPIPNLEWKLRVFLEAVRP